MVSSPAIDSPIETVASNVPVTAQRKLNLHLQEQLPKPYLARAVAAVDADHPNGTEGRDNRGMSVLQQHVAFFDRNNDGVVYPWETYQGFRAVGFGFLTSVFGGLFINLGLSYGSQPVIIPEQESSHSAAQGWLPSPLLSVHVKTIHRCKHGSDTEAYDTEGRFEPSKFEAIFSKYALTHADALTSDEISTMLKANRNLLDVLGWVASLAEWKLLYAIGKDETGLLQKEIVRGVYDGSLFEQLEKKRASRSKVI